MLQPVVCMLGADAARIFYGGDRFTRRGAVPKPTLTLLQDKGSVQLLDGEPHRHRKRMFMSLMSPDAVARLATIAAEEWHARVERWKARDPVVLFPEIEEILGRAVCRWAGIALSEQEAHDRTRELSAMIEGAGSVGLRNLRGQLLRVRSELWARDLVRKVRRGEVAVSGGSALQAIAVHREVDGELLPRKIAGVELLNVLRPTVAVGRFVTFAALALHEHPECRGRIAAGDEEYLGYFVQEIRRFYPFFPFVGGRVRAAFEWRGHSFAEGDWVLLDLYGTNHDVRAWGDPHVFRPERFRDRPESAFDFIAQGGGDFFTNHRCPGERATIELMRTLVRLLAALDYEVPAQDLHIDLSRFPAIPRSRFVIRKVGAALM
jgi:fatty-acid peroxygenase